MESAERSSLGVMEVLIIFGFTAFFAWYFLLILGYPSYFPAGEPSPVRHINQALVFAGMIVGGLVAIRSPRAFEINALALVNTLFWALFGCVVPLTVMLELIGVTIPYPVIFVITFVAGIGAGYFFTGWEDLCSRGRLRDTLVSVGLIMSLALGLFLVISLFMDQSAQGVMGMILILTNAALFYGVASRRDKGEASAKSKDKPAEENEAKSTGKDVRQSFNRKLSSLLFAANIPLGYGLPLIFTFDRLYFYIAIVVALACLVSFIVITRARKKDLTFITLLRGTIGASAVAMLLAGISESLFLLCSIILLAVWLMLRLAHSGTLIRLTRVQKTNPVFLTTLGKLPGYCGFLLGFVASVIIVDATDGVDIVIAGELVIVGVLIVSSLVLFPFSENYDKRLSVVPVVVDTRASSAEDIEHAKCAELAKRYGLSPREEEILFYIVRGRNARYIAEKLVISESTAKTHIHNIYKKSGIHSQQKFIDIMDELV